MHNKLKTVIPCCTLVRRGLEVACFTSSGGMKNAVRYNVGI